MRHVCCTHPSCINAFAPYSDDEPEGVIKLCTFCARALSELPLDTMRARLTVLSSERAAQMPKGLIPGSGGGA